VLLICLHSFATEDTHLGVAFCDLPRGDPQNPLCPCASAVYGNCDIKMKYLGRGGKSDKTLKQVFSHFFFPSFPPFPKRAFAGARGISSPSALSGNKDAFFLGVTLYHFIKGDERIYSLNFNCTDLNIQIVDK